MNFFARSALPRSPKLVQPESTISEKLKKFFCFIEAKIDVLLLHGGGLLSFAGCKGGFSNSRSCSVSGNGGILGNWGVFRERSS